jgi:hypothetical protein
LSDKQKARNGSVAGFELFSVTSQRLQALPGRPSGALDVGGLLPLWTLRDLEAYLLTFLECLEAVHLDCREMGKQILAPIVGRDEAIALRVVKPLNSASCHTPFPEKNAGRTPADCLSFKVRVVIGRTAPAVSLKPNTNTLCRIFDLGSQVRPGARKHLLQRDFTALPAVLAAAGSALVISPFISKIRSWALAVEAR